MPVPLIPLIVGGAGLLGAGWLGGKSSGGAVDFNTELFTKKQSTQITDTSQTTNTSVYSPTITRTYDVQYNIASGGSSISTKKEMGISPTTSTSATPSLVVIPQTSQGGGSSIGGGSEGGAGFDFMTPLVIAGFVAGGYFLIKKGDKK